MVILAKYKVIKGKVRVGLMVPQKIREWLDVKTKEVRRSVNDYVNIELEKLCEKDLKKKGE